MLLRNKDKEALVALFSSFHIPFEVWAYGSRVNGSAHEGSDLDLVIRTKKETPFPFVVYSEINDKLKNSNIPILVELKEWNSLPDHFHRNIEQNYEILFSSQD